jgi:hypothetical protein
VGTSLRIITLLAALACVPIASAGAAPVTVDSIPQEDTRVFGSEIAVERDGSATIIWPAVQAGETQVRLVHRRPGGELSPVETIATSEYLAEPDLALNRAGRGFVAWYDDGSGDVSVAPIDSSGGVGEPRVVGKGYSVDVEVDRSGDGTVLWRSTKGLSAARLAEDGSAKHVRTISRATPDEVSFDIDRQGRATVAVVGDRDIRVLRVAAGASLRTDEVLRRPAASLTVGEAPAVAIDGDGSSTVAWLAMRRGATTVKSVLVRPSGRHARVEDVTNGADRNASFPTVVSSVRGWIVAWSSRTEKRLSNQILFSRLSEGGAPSRAIPLSGSEDAKQVALTAGRTVTAIWRTTSIGRGGDESCIATRKISPAGTPRGLTRVRGTCPASQGPVTGAAGNGAIVGSWTSARRVGVIVAGPLAR